MSSTHYSKDDYVKEVCRHIQSKVDHKEIKKELYDHIEDAQEFYDTEEIQDFMGDPQEIGESLNDVYKPWIGYAWMVSNVIIAILVVFIAATGVKYYKHMQGNPTETQVVRLGLDSQPALVSRSVYDKGSMYTLRAIGLSDSDEENLIFMSVYQGNYSSVFKPELVQNVSINGKDYDFEIIDFTHANNNLTLKINGNIDIIDTVEITINNKVVKAEKGTN